jgi:GntR family transcriptional regulator
VDRKTIETNRLDGAALTSDAPLRTPLYHQIYLLMRQKITEGSFKDGELLPGEIDLAGLYGVSRITVKRALDELARDGFVSRRRGRGTSVTHAPTESAVRASFEGQLEDLLAMGLETKVKLLDFGFINASDEVTAALGLPPGARVQRSIRVRSSKSGPFSYLTTFVPGDIGERIGRKALAGRPLLAILEDLGVRIAIAEQTISATLADTTTAAALDMAVGGALIQVMRIVQDQDGRPVEFITALYRPDRYQVSMTLSRRDTDSARVWAPRETGYRLS